MTQFVQRPDALRIQRIIAAELIHTTLALNNDDAIFDDFVLGRFQGFIVHGDFHASRAVIEGQDGHPPAATSHEPYRDDEPRHPALAGAQFGNARAGQARQLPPVTIDRVSTQIQA